MPISELSDDHDVWLTRLSDHLKEERYGSCARAYILRTKRFIGYLQKKALSVHAAQPSDVEKYLHTLRRHAASAHEAPHVLDGLLYHESCLVIDEHYTDTGGFSDHVFAVCRAFGFRFAPRICNLKEKRLYSMPGVKVPPELEFLVTGHRSI
jgi:hypothetical protein